MIKLHLSESPVSQEQVCLSTPAALHHWLEAFSEAQPQVLRDCQSVRVPVGGELKKHSLFLGINAPADFPVCYKDHMSVCKPAETTMIDKDRPIRTMPSRWSNAHLPRSMCLLGGRWETARNILSVQFSHSVRKKKVSTYYLYNDRIGKLRENGFSIKKKNI